MNNNKPDWVNLNISEASEILGVERRHLGNTIAPIMMATDDAWQEAPGYPWAFRRSSMLKWQNFLADRAQLIEKGVWNQKRAYSVDDYDDWLAEEYNAFLKVGQKPHS